MSESNHSPGACPKCGATLPSAATAGLCPRCLMAEAMAATQVEAAPATAQNTLSPEELAPHFPQLEILESLGRGGMGVVYKARQKSLNRLVALKLLAPERVTDAAFADRFTREAHALAALNHPNIVTIHDFGQAGGFYFLLMEFVDGVNLRQAMKAGRFTPEQALAVVPPVCEALQYAHEHGIVHRDIKPENLLLDKDGRVKIADFGIAKLVARDSDLATTGQADATLESRATLGAGTPQYMAPEQKAHRATDHRADIYSLGVVLYELLTGERPKEDLVPPSKRVQVDVRIDEIVLRALEKRPELRFATAEDFRTQVEMLSTPAAATGRLSLKPWERSWLAWPEGRRAFLQGMLFLLALTLTLCFGWIHREVVPSPPDLVKGAFQHEVRIHVGAGRPWLTEFEQLTNRGRQSGSEFHRATPSFFCGLTALAVWILLTRLVRVTQGRALIRLRTPPDAKGHSQVLWPNFFAAWIGVVAAVSLSTLLLIAAMTSFGRGGPPMIPSLLVSIIPASMVVFMGLRLPPARNETGAQPAASVEHVRPPRISRTAVVGACWVPFFFIGLVAMYSVMQVASGTDSGTAWWQLALRFTLLPLAVAAPFGTTILGWIAVSQIRRSAGKLYGLGLAVFDGVLFPLLALDGLIVWLSIYLKRLLVGFYANPSVIGDPRIDPPFITRLANDLMNQGVSSALLTIVTVLAILVVDFLIIRAVWRAANRAPGGSSAASPAKPRSGCLRVVAIVGMVMLASFGIVLLVYTSSRQALPLVTPSYTPVRLEKNMVILDFQAVVLRGPCEVEVNLGGTGWTANGATTENHPEGLAADTDVITPDHSGSARTLKTGTTAWRVAFVLPTESLAREAWENLQPVGPLKVRPDRKIGGAVFEVKASTGATYSALFLAGPIGPHIAVGDDFPRGAHIGRNDHSVLVTHGTAALHYVFYYAGDFGSSSSGSQNKQTHSWTDEGAVKLKNGRTFGYRRTALYPDHLTVNGTEYDLRKGRVFVLRDDATLEQLSVPVSLSVAKDPVALGALLEEHGGATNGAAASPEVGKPKSACVTSLLLDANGKPMPQTTIAFMEAGGTVSKTKTRGQIASGLTDDLGFVHTLGAPPDRPWEIVVLRDGEEIMRSAPIRTPVSANSPIGAPNYLLELQANAEAKLDAQLTPLSLEANQAAHDAASDQVIAARLAMAAMLQKLRDIPVDSAGKGAAFLPGPGAVVPVTKRAEVAGQLDRLYRQIRSGGEAAADAPSEAARPSSAELPKSVAPAPPDALFSVEQPVVVGGDMMVRVRLLMADKDGKRQPLDEEIIFKTAKDRATGFVLRWHAYDDKHPQQANDVLVHLVDPDTGVILHSMEGGFGSGLRLTSPDHLPLPAKNKSHLLARPGVHTSFHLIRAETPAAPGAPITDWRDLHAEVTLINPAKERPVPAFQMPTLAPKTAPPAKAAPAVAPLIRREVRDKTRDGRDIVMTFEELQRDEKTSTVMVKTVNGGSVGSAMFEVRGNWDIAKARGAAYFINLKSWQGENGEWMSLVGFAPNKDINPQEYFGLKEPLPDDPKHRPLRVSDYDRIFQGQP